MAGAREEGEAPGLWKGRGCVSSIIPHTYLAAAKKAPKGKDAAKPAPKEAAPEEAAPKEAAPKEAPLEEAPPESPKGEIVSSGLSRIWTPSIPQSPLAPLHPLCPPHGPRADPPLPSLPRLRQAKQSP